MSHEAFFQVEGPMTKILVLRNNRVFKGLFIHLIDCEHDQDVGLPFSHVFKQVGHWSNYLEKRHMDKLRSTNIFYYLRCGSAKRNSGFRGTVFTLDETHSNIERKEPTVLSSWKSVRSIERSQRMRRRC